MESHLRRYLRKFKWTLINVVFPEFILAHAFNEREVAVDDLNALRAKMLSLERRPSRFDMPVNSRHGHWTIESETCWKRVIMRPLRSFKLLSSGVSLKDMETGVPTTKTDTTVVTTTSVCTE